MPYIILSSEGQELDRLKLVDAILIGRSTECDLPVRDVLMSRRHCRLEPAGRGWRIVDLQSKNGLHFGTEQIERKTLSDGDELRLGRTTLRYCAGEFQPAPPELSIKPQRPADPFEALAGTISGMVLEQQTEEPAFHTGWAEPFSEPSPSHFAQWGDAQLVGQMVHAQRPAPTPMPRPHSRPSGLRRPIQRPVDDVSLQVTPNLLAEPIHYTAATLHAPSVEWRLLLVLAIGSAATVLLFMSNWWRTVLS
ncbi:MAG: FHA domain-containing protein [Phycisphaerales bacterium]|nr:FHA domain-containing protein [Phycisphaerales bacterium]